MKRYAVIFLLLNFFAICSLSAEEQSSENFKKKNFSIILGVGTNELKSSGTNDDSKEETSVFIGVGWEYRFSNKWFSIEPQFYEISKNYKYESTAYTFTDKSSYFEIPVLAKFSYNFKNIPGRVYYAVGPQVSFLFWHSTDFKNGTTTLTEADKTEMEKRLKPISVNGGVVLAVGGVYKKFLIEVRADIVGGDILDYPTFTNKYHYSSGHLTLGYIF